MKSFISFLTESGGRMMMGMNPLQMKTRDIIRFINQWKEHVTVDGSGRHNKLIGKDGSVITTFTRGELGPKSALSTISRLRDYLVSQGVYTLKPGERSSIIKRRQNSSQAVESQEAIKKSRQEKINRVVERLKSGSLGAQKRKRLEQIVARNR
jgi:hypothetical protein